MGRSVPLTVASRQSGFADTFVKNEGGNTPFFATASRYAVKLSSGGKLARSAQRTRTASRI